MRSSPAVALAVVAALAPSILAATPLNANVEHCKTCMAELSFLLWLCELYFCFHNGAGTEDAVYYSGRDREMCDL
ncbi:hypothetical protein EDD22DRAFT_894643 [Suillus occidentalis]|nr:hypothetical protein EDD22DRAFT_894643 [Suillus occidentalis]